MAHGNRGTSDLLALKPAWREDRDQIARQTDRMAEWREALQQ